jgi:hypothetical protein
MPLTDDTHREALRDAAKALYLALATESTDDGSKSPTVDGAGPKPTAK